MNEPYSGRGTNRPGAQHHEAHDGRRTGGKCPVCGRASDTLQGLAVHMAKAHDITGPRRLK